MTGQSHAVHTSTIGVGGWVVRADGAALLVRMTYGPAKGRLMVPGGHSEPDEMVDETAVREVREETGIEAVPRGIVMVRQRVDGDLRNLYVVFLMTPRDHAEAVPDGTEVSETIWLTPTAILEREDVQPIATELAAAQLAAPDSCLARRELSWQPADVYRLWAGHPARPPDRGVG